LPQLPAYPPSLVAAGRSLASSRHGRSHLHEQDQHHGDRKWGKPPFHAPGRSAGTGKRSAGRSSIQSTPARAVLHSTLRVHATAPSHTKAARTEESVTRPTAIRNVALVGHHGAGKTTLTEALLAATGALARRGSVEKGPRPVISSPRRSRASCPSPPRWHRSRSAGEGEPARHPRLRRLRLRDVDALASADLAV